MAAESSVEWCVWWCMHYERRYWNPPSLHLCVRIPSFYRYSTENFMPRANALSHAVWYSDFRFQYSI